MIKKIIYIVIVLLALFAINTSYNHFNKKQNLKIILSENLDGRMVPHEINTMDRLNEIIKNGIRSYEIDVHFNTKDNVSYFEIGHDNEDLHGATLESYLKQTKQLKIKKIWMDVKNMSDENIDKALEHLKKLDAQYHIKNIIIFETPVKSEKLKKISDAGFHTSLYITNSPIDKMLKENDKELMKKEAKNIANQISIRHSKAISFNSMLYPFVKTYLEPIVPKNIVYHTWKSVKLQDRNAIKDVKNTKYFKDTRVKTILYYYFPRR
jgi:heptose-I-phosphate ethanolaminephosphotransferase